MNRYFQYCFRQLQNTYDRFKYNMWMCDIWNFNTTQAFTMRCLPAWRFVNSKRSALSRQTYNWYFQYVCCIVSFTYRNVWARISNMAYTYNMINSPGIPFVCFELTSRFHCRRFAGISCCGFASLKCGRIVILIMARIVYRRKKGVNAESLIVVAFSSKLECNNGNSNCIRLKSNKLTNAFAIHLIETFNAMRRLSRCWK